MKYVRTLVVVVAFVAVFVALLGVAGWFGGEQHDPRSVGVALAAVDDAPDTDTDEHDDDPAGDWDEGNRPVPLDALPDPVRQTLWELVGHDDLDVWQEHEHGMVVYEGRWHEGEVEVEAEVNADGVLLELEETVPQAAVPQAVRDAVDEHVPNATDVSFVKMTVYLYEVEVAVDGRKLEYTILPNGNIIPQDD